MTDLDTSYLAKGGKIADWIMTYNKKLSWRETIFCNLDQKRTNGACRTCEG